MKETILIKKNNDYELIDIESIYKDIKEKIITARTKMLKHIDTTMIEVYWYVGKVTYELSENSTKASYGKKIVDALSARLTNENPLPNSNKNSVKWDNRALSKSVSK